MKNIDENNVIDWYPFEDNIKYSILRDFSKDKVQELEDAIQKLPEDGKILIIAKNKLALKNICEISEEDSKLYNRREIEELLDSYGLIHRKFYYPLPSLKTTNVIFTDEFLPTIETLNRNIEFYEKKTIVKNNENKLYKEILGQDKELFKIFANIFFIECSKTDFKDNNIEFVSYSNMRKEEYRIRTTIKKDNVYKQAINERQKEHIEQIKKNIDIMNKINLNTLDSYTEDKIISKYQKGKETFDKTVSKYTQEEVATLITNLFCELKEKLQVIVPDTNVFNKYGIEYKDEDIQNLTFVKYGLWDLIFQNMFYIDNKYYFYDQEWYEENLPLEFIIYRSFVYSSGLKNIEEQIYKKFNINEKHIEMFEKLDRQLQLKTRDDLNWNMHINAVSVEEKIQELELDKEKITNDCIKLLNEKDARIKFLEDNMKATCDLLNDKEQELNVMKQSISWKIRKNFRKLRK